MMSEAQAFFEKHKALFEYDKYFPGRDPTEGSSFLSPALLGTPAGWNESTFEATMLVLSAAPAYVPTIPKAIAPKTLNAVGFSLPLMQQNESPPHQIPRSNQRVAVAMEAELPTRDQVSTSRLTAVGSVVAPVAGATVVSFGAPSAVAPRDNQSSSASSQKPILLDSSMRTLARKVDMAQKIEQLVGPKYGRVIGPSSNLPISVRRRLEAYAKIDQRKEALYQLMRQEHAELVAQHKRRRC
ncbi:hypothetical protein ACHHYP_15641 [Achlya hypogyna]|uniref:Uncharacterized protein n=1 Tax=Achlya hypogyna TaxID=1202772 RepID=A0A1V9YAC2_ACHHY|nr:hypothetical protein ACHHYP_15641 [Achlya hypogyna]